MSTKEWFVFVVVSVTRNPLSYNRAGRGAVDYLAKCPAAVTQLCPCTAVHGIAAIRFVMTV